MRTVLATEWRGQPAPEQPDEYAGRRSATKHDLEQHAASARIEICLNRGMRDGNDEERQDERRDELCRARRVFGSYVIYD